MMTTLILAAVVVLFMNYLRNPKTRNPFKSPGTGATKRWKWRWLPYKTQDKGWKMLCWTSRSKGGYRGYFG